MRFDGMLMDYGNDKSSHNCFFAVASGSLALPGLAREASGLSSGTCYFESLLPRSSDLFLFAEIPRTVLAHRFARDDAGGSTSGFNYAYLFRQHLLRFVTSKPSLLFCLQSDQWT